jgi:hypothetical protein
MLFRYILYNEEKTTDLTSDLWSANMDFWFGIPASSLLRFAHKTPKNRRSGDFLPCKLRKDAQ